MANTQMKKKGGICATLCHPYEGILIIVHLKMICDAELLCYCVIMISWFHEVKWNFYFHYYMPLLEICSFVSVKWHG